MDKIDGPYYFFKAIQRTRQLLPEWVPLVGLDLGYTNVVPVDWVAGALEHIAHEPDLDGRAFHLTDPRPQRVDELINELAAAAHAPALRRERRQTADRRRCRSGRSRSPPRCRRARQLRELALRELGIPAEVLGHMELDPALRHAARPARALAGSALEQPPPLQRLRAAAVGLLGARDGPATSAADARCARRSAASTC